MTKLLSALLVLALSGCGGGSSPAPEIIPTAQAAEAFSGCPTGDATALLQGMVDKASGRLELPACVFNTSAPIVINKPLRLVGSDATVNGTVIRTTADEALVIDPAVTVKVSQGFSQRGWWGSVEHLRIDHAVSGGGKHGLVLRVRPGFFLNNWRIAHVHVGDFGEQAIWLDNSAGNVDGIFSGTIEDVWASNGYLFTQVGDSVKVSGGTTTNGPSRFGKPGLPGFDISMIPGAAELTIERVNITTNGGCVYVRNGTGVNILNNWCESTGQGSASGLLYLKDCAECTLRDNRVQTLGGDALYALVVDGGEYTVIDSNKLNLGKSGHIAFTNGAKLNKLAGLNRFIGSPNPLVGQIVNSASGLIQ